MGRDYGAIGIVWRRAMKRGSMFLACVLAALIAVFDGGRTSQAATLEQGSLELDGLQREYFVHVPLRRSPQSAMGVVFALHGGAGRAKQFADYLNFDEHAESRNLLIVYPQGFERHWNDGRPDVAYESHDRNIDDVGFLRAVLEQLASLYPIDRRRVFAAGISNGGMMSLRLACEAADVFAGVAIVTASFPLTTYKSCNPGRTVAIMLMNGTEDPLVPYNGGEIRLGRRTFGEVRSTEETFARWIDLNGCEGRPVVASLTDADPDDGSRVTVERYLPCRDGSEVALYRVEGGGHTWPGLPGYLPRWIIGRSNGDIDGTRHILDFFGRHAMPPN